MSTILFEIAMTLYFASMVVGIVEFFRSSRGTSAIMLSLTAAGFVLHTAGIVARYVMTGHIPIVSPHEATSFFAWCIVLIFLSLEIRLRPGLLGSFIMPLVFSLMLLASLFTRDVTPLDPVLRSNWLLFHTLFAFLANACFAMAAGVGIMYLVQEHFVRTKHLGGMFHRLPSLQSLDDISHRLITVGFPLLSLAIVTGVFWANSVWGSYWRWDPREVWSLITWLIFAMILYTRLVAGWRGRRASVLTVLGFASVLVAFFGVKLLEKGVHLF